MLLCILLVTKKKEQGERESRGEGETGAGNEGGTILDKDECGKPPFISDPFSYTST